ncbi:MAG: DMT family transporter [Chloroflexota bacterium]
MFSGRGASLRRWLPHLLLFVVVLIWSGNTVVSKLVMKDVPAPQLVLVRFSLGVLAFHVPLLLAMGHRGAQLSRSDVVRLFAIGAGGAGTSVLLFTIGLSYAPATYTSLISMIGPPLTALMAWVLFREVLGWTRALGTAIAFLGAALLVTGGQLADPQPGLLFGTSFLIASQAAWAIYILYGKPLLAHRPPILVMSASHAFALLSVWPLSVPIGGWDFVWDAWHWSLGVWMGILYLAIVNTGLSQLMFLYALREVSSAQAVSYTYLQPAMTAMMAMFALGEQPTVMTLACGVVILLGIWLVNRPRVILPARNEVGAASARRAGEDVTAARR